MKSSKQSKQKENLAHKDLEGLYYKVLTAMEGRHCSAATAILLSLPSLGLGQSKGKEVRKWKRREAAGGGKGELGDG